MVLDIYFFLVACPLIFLAGFIDAVGGGGGFISLPAYLLSGLPPHLALGTNKLSSTMGTFLATLRYAKLGYIRYKDAAVAVIFAILGSSIGAELVLWIPDMALKISIMVILPLTAFYLLRYRKFGEPDQSKYSRLYVVLTCAMIAFFVGIYDGIYGPGTGTFLLLGFCALAKYSVQNANGLTKAINLTTNIAALSVFLHHDSVVIYMGLIAGLFNIAGNYVGCSFFVRKGMKGTKLIMLLVIALFEAKLCWDFLS